MVGGTFDVYEDANNPKSTTEDKEKALTVDVASTAATVGADLLIAATLPASVPIIAGIAIGVVVGAGISYGAKWAKKEWIDR